MSTLIRHTASEPQKPLWKIIIYIIGIVLAINYLVELTNLLPKNIAAIASVLVLILTAALCSYVINRKLAKYTYLFIENELVFYKQIGKRENKVIDVKTWEMEWIKPLHEVNQKIKYKKTYWMSCRFRGPSVYAAQFKRNNHLYRVVFQPNESLHKELYRQIKVNNK
ncbi:hypothetical protein [Alkaliphilus peptidifermentans]|uniref:Uncharacterized protein n=1 Tax=Alkaliphilus peptidifermentans DSM 18978 TaxID=1120976 RepID=A0A1G5AQ61_9FIRM|nr:hypothetical protein [Alkaliphilus peptidifermentans]SCX79960.1 hypothetical protein SAMN03080606_00241 [Alkaliphilus peptidifermentans DSM 18978]